MRIWHVSVVLAAVLMLAMTQSVWAQSKPAGGDPVDDALESTDESPVLKDDKNAGKDGGKATTQGAGGGGGSPPRGIFDNPKILIAMVAVMALLWWWMGRGRRKEQQHHKEMMSAMKKGDKVTSIGGIIGTVVEVRDKEIVVKVDESSNVRMKFLRSAIRNIGSAGKDEDGDKGSGKS